MWTLLEATFYLTFAIFSPSSVFLILSFKNTRNQMHIKFSNFSINLFKSESRLGEAFSCQTIPSYQPDVDVVFSHFCNMLITLAGKHSPLRISQIVYFRSVLAMNNKWDQKIYENEELTKLINYSAFLSLFFLLSLSLVNYFINLKCYAVHFVSFQHESPNYTYFAFPLTPARKLN